MQVQSVHNMGVLDGAQTSVGLVTHLWMGRSHRDLQQPRAQSPVGPTPKKSGEFHWVPRGRRLWCSSYGAVLRISLLPDLSPLAGKLGGKQGQNRKGLPLRPFCRQGHHWPNCQKSFDNIGRDVCEGPDEFGFPHVPTFTWFQLLHQPYHP